MDSPSPTLPLPSYARVTNVATGKSVVVRVNDRGPFLHDRVIDLSYAAAHRIGIAQKGSGEVEVEAILPGAPALREAVSAWAATTLHADVAPAAILPLVGSKELVSLLPTLLDLGPDDTVVIIADKLAPAGQVAKGWCTQSGDGVG